MRIEDLLNEYCRDLQLGSVAEFIAKHNAKFEKALSDLNNGLDVYKTFQGKDIKDIGIKGMTFIVLETLAIRREGKKLTDFSDEDWKRVVNTTCQGAVILDDALYSKLVFQFYADALEASSLAFDKDEAAEIRKPVKELEKLIEAYSNGDLPEVKFIEEAEMHTLESIFKLMASYIGQRVPEENAELVSNVSSLMFELVRYRIYGYEQEILKELEQERDKESEALMNRYNLYKEKLDENIAVVSALIDKAFSADFHEAFEGSVSLARYVGVTEENILKSIDDADEFFL